MQHQDAQRRGQCLISSLASWQLWRVKVSHATVCRDKDNQVMDVKGTVLSVSPSSTSAEGSAITGSL